MPNGFLDPYAENNGLVVRLGRGQHGISLALSDKMIAHGIRLSDLVWPSRSHLGLGRADNREPGNTGRAGRLTYPRQVCTSVRLAGLRGSDPIR
jgi:hypothetical protein